MAYIAEDTPATVRYRPTEEAFSIKSRSFQGIPSIECTRGGRLWCCYYGGALEEQNGNYVVVAVSDDGGGTWTEPYIIIHHEDPGMRLFDPNVWMDPMGRLWITYSQSHGFFDGRHGVWAVVIDDPDAERPALPVPRRIANGVMMDKPTVLRNGEWLFPCAIWACAEPSELRPELENERRSNVYASKDGGATFFLRGGADVPNRSFDEHMLVERRGGELWMLVRRYDGIGEATSRDGGRTWLQEGHSGICSPSSRFFIRRLLSGNLLLVNHVDFRGRNNLMAKLSFDDGHTWTGGLMLDTRDNISYPDGCQRPDGLIYITYDRERLKDREILMAAFREQDILHGLLISEDTRLRTVVCRGVN